MIRTPLALIAACAALAAAAPALASAPQPTAPVDASAMAGRWYEVARIPNRMQKDCQAGTSDWVRSGDGYTVIQVCHKGAPTAPGTEWRAKAKVVDPRTNAKFKMSFFGGLLNQEYWVLDNRPDQGWLILATPGGHFLWLMSQRPSLAATAKAQALSRIRQLGYDVGRLEFPAPARD
ncbi:lipocalin family protein [Phenylobacterium sp.]|jgi:apolipoprotein D and lipocalin family protein|uniref:lipocalin family protein n=1 Tax=Phenylobacterium sp. TaxID=1871053 RepID=UPI002F3F96F4